MPKTFDCKVKGSVKLNRTDDLVFETIVNTLENSSLFKELIKTEVLSQGSHRQSKNEVKKKNTKVNKLRKEIDTINGSINNLNGMILLGTDEGIQYQSTVDLLTKKKNEIINEIMSIEEGVTIEERNIKWNDWLSEFRDRISTIKHETDISKKKRFIDGVVERIEVLPKFDGGLEHQITIHFNLPYIDDKLVWKDENKKSLGYEVIDGINEIQLRFNDGKKSETN